MTQKLKNDELFAECDEGKKVTTKESLKVVPFPFFWKKVYFWLTCWRPLTKYESKKYDVMIIRLGRAMVNLYQKQEMLVKNNNMIMQQLSGQQVVKQERKQAVNESDTKEEENNDDKSIYA